MPVKETFRCSGLHSSSLQSNPRCTQLIPEGHSRKECGRVSRSGASIRVLLTLRIHGGTFVTLPRDNQSTQRPVSAGPPQAFQCARTLQLAARRHQQVQRRPRLALSPRPPGEPCRRSAPRRSPAAAYSAPLQGSAPCRPSLPGRPEAVPPPTSARSRASPAPSAFSRRSPVRHPPRATAARRGGAPRPHPCPPGRSRPSRHWPPHSCDRPVVAGSGSAGGLMPWQGNTAGVYSMPAPPDFQPAVSAGRTIQTCLNSDHFPRLSWPALAQLAMSLFPGQIQAPS